MKREISKDTIIDTAVRLFAKKGFHATSLREIGEDCGIYPSMTIYYFSSKDGLLREILQRIIWQLKTLATAVGHKKGAWNQLHFFTQQTIAWMHEHNNLACILFQELSLSRSSNNAHLLEELAQLHRNLFQRLLRDGEATGEFGHIPDKTFLYHVTFGTFVHFWNIANFSSACGTGSKNEPDTIVNQLIDLLAAQLKK